MRDLYRRLKAAGYDRPFLQKTVLPDWWDDSLAEVPFNRAVAESAIAGHLGYKIALLADPTATLPPPQSDGVLFKKSRGSTPSKLLPNLQVARRAASLTAASAQGIPEFD